MDHSNNSPEPAPNLPARTPRHDGWNPDRMATFLEVLADTGIVADAVRAVGMERSGAYALRNRDPIVAAAWRDRFFDMLRSELAATTRHPELGSGSIPETRTAFQRNGC